MQVEIRWHTLVNFARLLTIRRTAADHHLRPTAHRISSTPVPVRANSRGRPVLIKNSAKRTFIANLHILPWHARLVRET